MRYVVKTSKRANKNIDKMPQKIRKLMQILIEDLESKGPERKEWDRYSKLSKNEYHCHLAYHWVACWRNENNSILIEVYYAGSRENAPY
jgi:mRNA-degrading endonuclease RelE of RelBE toxin-antitoxin system